MDPNQLQQKKEGKPFDSAQAKKARTENAIRKKKVTRMVVTMVCILAAAGLIYGGIRFAAYRTQSMPGVGYSEQGRQHVASGNVFEYNSNPPTSGPHFGEPALWGVYKEELTDEQLIHNLEHGGVWISYKPGIPDDIKQKLEGMHKKYGTKIIVAPRSKNDTDVALAVWTRLDKFNISDFSEMRVEIFIRRLRNRLGPEPLAP